MTPSPLLMLHIAAGTAGLLSGAAALVFRKGSGRHRAVGKVFAVSMLTMAFSASWLAYLVREWSNFLGGITTVYVIATAWMTLRLTEKP